MSISYVFRKICSTSPIEATSFRIALTAIAAGLVVAPGISSAKAFSTQQACAVTSNLISESKPFTLSAGPSGGEVQIGSVKFQGFLVQVERERPQGVGGTHEVMRVKVQPQAATKSQLVKSKQEFSSSFGPATDVERNGQGFPKQIEATARLQDGSILFVRCPLSKT